VRQRKRTEDFERLPDSADHAELAARHLIESARRPRLNHFHTVSQLGQGSVQSFPQAFERHLVLLFQFRLVFVKSKPLRALRESRNGHGTLALWRMSESCGRNGHHELRQFRVVSLSLLPVREREEMLCRKARARLFIHPQKEQVRAPAAQVLESLANFIRRLRRASELAVGVPRSQVADDSARGLYCFAA
jgi:hypothetical protein